MTTTTTRDQAKQVASEATDRARDLAGEARTQLRHQSDTQRERLAGTLHELGDELHSMADQGNGSGIGTELARQAAGRLHGLGDYVQRHRPGDLLDDVRAFARRRPGTFLLAAAGAGVAAGRLTRGATAAARSAGGASEGASDGASGHGNGATATAGGRAVPAVDPAPPPVAPPATAPAAPVTGRTGVIAVEAEPDGSPQVTRGLP